MAEKLRGSGGTEGGCGLFLLGLVLAVGGLWLFLDSVEARAGYAGWFTRGLHAAGLHGGYTTSMGVVFVPFFLGIFLLFYNSKWKAGWALTGLGLLIIVVEILSGIRFTLRIKTTHLLMLFVMMAGGLGMIVRSFRDSSQGG